MLQRVGDRNLFVLYANTLLFGTACGVSIALAPLYLHAQHFTVREIGTLASWFALGVVCLSLPVGVLIRRFSARAVLTVSLLGYALCVSRFPHLTSYATIAAARIFDGAFSVGVWVSGETILLSRARTEHKAFATSLYAVSIALGYMLGPLAARGIVAVASMQTAFLLAGLLALAGALVVMWKLDPDTRDLHLHDAPTDREFTPALRILSRIKTSCFGTFAYGYFQSSVVLFLPIFLVTSKGIPEKQTILITAFFAAGMLLFSNIAGRASDKLGHLRTMVVLAVIGALMTGSFVWLDYFWQMALAVFVAGATIASISPVSLALQGVVTEPWNYARSNAIYNTFYAAGMLLGPTVSSEIYQRHQGQGMLYHLAALWLAFAVFGTVFAKDDPAARRAPAKLAQP